MLLLESDPMGRLRVELARVSQVVPASRDAIGCIVRIVFCGCQMRQGSGPAHRLTEAERLELQLMCPWCSVCCGGYETGFVPFDSHVLFSRFRSTIRFSGSSSMPVSFFPMNRYRLT